MKFQPIHVFVYAVFTDGFHPVLLIKPQPFQPSLSSPPGGDDKGYTPSVNVRVVVLPPNGGLASQMPVGTKDPGLRPVAHASPASRIASVQEYFPQTT